MRCLIFVFALINVGALGCSPRRPSIQRVHSVEEGRAQPQPERSPGEALSDSDRLLQRAFEQHASDLRVEGRGAVTRILSDDNDGSPHQRFILALGSGQTLLVAHNIAVAPRIDGLQTGDEVAFRGEYAWNPQGGVIHWTHHDPDGRHPDGWLKHKGKTYQ